MKTKTIMTSMLTLAVSAAIAFAESYYVITVTDFLGNKTFDSVTKEELKAKQLEIKQKNKLLPKVLQQIQKEMRDNPEEHEGEKFYGKKLKLMTIKFKGPINDGAKAKEQSDKLQEKADNKEIEEAMGSKKRLSDEEKEKAYEEAQKESEIRNFAEEVEKQIEEMMNPSEE